MESAIHGMKHILQNITFSKIFFVDAYNMVMFLQKINFFCKNKNIFIKNKTFGAKILPRAKFYSAILPVVIFSQYSVIY